MLEVAKLQQSAAMGQAKILELKAHAAQLMASADGEGTQQQISMINARVGAAKLHNETILKGADLMLKRHQAMDGSEAHHHKMLMDVQDRLMARESENRENMASQQPSGDAA
jgi:hypothetical protein